MYGRVILEAATDAQAKSVQLHPTGAKVLRSGVQGAAESARLPLKRRLLSIGMIIGAAQISELIRPHLFYGVASRLAEQGAESPISRTGAYQRSSDWAAPDPGALRSPPHESGEERKHVVRGTPAAPGFALGSFLQSWLQLQAACKGSALQSVPACCQSRPGYEIRSRCSC
ncbi:hypothetical protein BDZ91DRAFT_767599 [Kalaharituber pfeilii]|nr:hypothetical protein BDZ91DRAFT_767599 [Kalaharituber pfeilii]